jgi:hypothetical protein
MKEVLWEMPVPSTTLTRGPFFVSLPQRRCEVSYYVESTDGERKGGLTFEGVEAYKCTHMSALSVEMIKEAYDRVVRIDDSPWLAEVSAISASHYERVEGSARELRHLMISFDDGPCYEFICVRFASL